MAYSKKEKSPLQKAVDEDQIKYVLGVDADAVYAEINAIQDIIKRASAKLLFKKLMDTQDPQAGFRLAQIMGWIVDKKEERITIGAIGDDLAKQHFEADRRLREGTVNRVVDVPKKPALLPDKICVDNESEHREDSEVARLGLSTRPPDSIPEA